MELINKKIICISKKASLSEAALFMKMKGVGCLLVIEPGTKKCVGIITDRDIVIYGIADGDHGNKTVEEVMSRQTVSVTEDTDIQNIIDKMFKNELRRIVIVDHDGNACGIVSSDDIVRFLGLELGKIGSLFEKQSRKIFENRSKEKIS